MDFLSTSYAGQCFLAHFCTIISLAKKKFIPLTLELPADFVPHLSQPFDFSIGLLQVVELSLDLAGY